MIHGADIGCWYATQRHDGKQLTDGQRERLTALGVTPAEQPAVPAPGPARARRADTGKAFERGVTALTQYKEREGRVVVPRAHEEHVPDGPVRLGVGLTNTRTRHTRHTTEQRAQLTALGLEWA